MFSGFDTQTWIDTPNGIVRASQLKLSDSVRTMNGIDSITSLETRHLSEALVINLAADTGNCIICSLNYSLPVVRFSLSPNDGKTFKNHYIESIPAHELQNGDYLFMPVHLNNQSNSFLTDLTRLRLWYTCEGSRNGDGAVVIGQSKEKNPAKYAEIKYLIEKVGWRAWCSFDRIAITRLAASSFDDLGTYADNKHLPCEVFSCSKEGMIEALEILIKADGHSRGRDDYFYSNSIQMAQETVALAMRVGRPATIQRISRTGTYDVHIPPANPSKPRYRFEGGRFRMVKVKKVSFSSQEHEIIQMKCSQSDTVIGGLRGLMVLSA